MLRSNEENEELLLQREKQALIVLEKLQWTIESTQHIPLLLAPILPLQDLHQMLQQQLPLVHSFHQPLKRN